MYSCVSEGSSTLLIMLVGLEHRVLHTGHDPKDLNVSSNILRTPYAPFSSDISLF